MLARIVYVRETIQMTKKKETQNSHSMKKKQ